MERVGIIVSVAQKPNRAKHDEYIGDVDCGRSEKNNVVCSESVENTIKEIAERTNRHTEKRERYRGEPLCSCARSLGEHADEHN